ncbi:MAG: single-stranded DNA-binding protein [Candidatus Delongbacteria bacterium]|jgi:single-strand DNA-binding protein|nr:single-stranded DNA-binding protein [Candidatus Delongbacteria bacterium]
MASVNKVFLIGNLGKDPDVKFTPSGVQIGKFSIATSERFKRGDNWEEKTDWHNIVLFGRQAEYAGEYLKKGMSVFIEGKISTRTWDDENGVRKYITEIIGNSVKNLSPRKDSGNSDYSAYTSNTQGNSQSNTQSNSQNESDSSNNNSNDDGPEDDLPF